MGPVRGSDMADKMRLTGVRLQAPAHGISAVIHDLTTVDSELG